MKFTTQTYLTLSYAIFVVVLNILFKERSSYKGKANVCRISFPNHILINPSPPHYWRGTLHHQTPSWAYCHHLLNPNMNLYPSALPTLLTSDTFASADYKFISLNVWMVCGNHLNRSPVSMSSRYHKLLLLSTNTAYNVARLEQSYIRDFSHLSWMTFLVENKYFLQFCALVQWVLLPPILCTIICVRDDAFPYHYF